MDFSYSANSFFIFMVSRLCFFFSSFIFLLSILIFQFNNMLLSFPYLCQNQYCSLIVELQVVIGTLVMIPVIAWTSRVRGPIFVSSFFPLMLIMSAIFSSLLLDEKLHLGRFELLKSTIPIYLLISLLIVF